MIKGKVSEVFDSVQGEGLYLGERQVFVRLFGCNLTCSYCDTRPQGFSDYDPQELFDEIKLYSEEPCHSISFTGGEPLMQKDFIKEVMKLARTQNIKNYLETNGTLPDELADIIDYVDFVSMDVKLPSSTGAEAEYWDTQKKFLKIASEKEVFVKAVICESTAVEDVRQAIRLIKEVNPSVILILQPDSCAAQDALKKKLKFFQEICRQEQVTACIIPQMHKIMGVR